MSVRFRFGDAVAVREQEKGCTPEGGIVEPGEVLIVADKNLDSPAVWCRRNGQRNMLLISIDNLFLLTNTAGAP